VPVVSSEQLQAVAFGEPLTGSAPISYDPEARSASTVDPEDILLEPAPSSGVPRRATAALPSPSAGSVPKNPWRYDRNVSFYGPGFYGKRTACGLAMTTTLMGVAHRSLPCGTLITFRNPANGRVKTVPVVDRGPYVAGRVWDLTGALCTYLGHCYTGAIEWRWRHPHF
jgi:rare lipoprotein A (peptidoglycan hydrolase)